MTFCGIVFLGPMNQMTKANFFLLTFYKYLLKKKTKEK